MHNALYECVSNRESRIRLRVFISFITKQYEQEINLFSWPTRGVLVRTLVLHRDVINKHKKFKEK